MDLEAAWYRRAMGLSKPAAAVIGALLVVVVIEAVWIRRTGAAVESLSARLETPSAATPVHESWWYCHADELHPSGDAAEGVWRTAIYECFDQRAQCDDLHETCVLATVAWCRTAADGFRQCYSTERQCFGPDKRLAHMCKRTAPAPHTR